MISNNKKFFFGSERPLGFLTLQDAGQTRGYALARKSPVSINRSTVTTRSPVLSRSHSLEVQIATFENFREEDGLSLEESKISLTLREPWVKTGGRLIKHERSYWLLLAERFPAG